MAASNTTVKPQDLSIARRLVTVVLSDFFCWFPIGLMGLLASHGVPLPGEVNVATAIFVLPVNSALNPFLYTFSVFMERRRKAKEERLMKYLESLAASKSKPEDKQGRGLPETYDRYGLMNVSKEEALSSFKKWIETDATYREKVKGFLENNQSD
nr:hypothetical protein BaRGS_022226 [Batillaria attramentaria]